MNVIYITFLVLCCSFMSIVSGKRCRQRTELSGEISDYSYSSSSDCWLIEIPQDSYVRLQLQIRSNGFNCSSANVKIFVSVTNETYTFCAKDTDPKPIIALNDVTVTYNRSTSSSGRHSFRLKFVTENLICSQKNHFRCSSSFCIPHYQVCNGFEDCENGVDEIGCEKGIAGVKGMNISRISAIKWLKSQQTELFDWSKNTHRAITALYLSRAMKFQGENLEEERIAKQLEFRTAIALLRNASDPISINELSMFVNALAVTCHNPRNFYGYDLLQILSDRMASSISPVPSAYLTLCNLNWTFSHSDVISLMNFLHKPSKYPFHSDVRALTIMALTCLKSKNCSGIAHAESLYNSTIQDFIDQLADGSFGNVYTTALVTQAFIASGEEKDKRWNATATAQYLMKQLDSTSVNFLSVYLTLPVLSGRSLVDIKSVNCSSITRKVGKDKEISEVMDKLGGGKMQIQYSLYIGDQKDVVHTIYLRMPQNSSAYDVMRVAQVADPKYKFLYRQNSDHIYIYEIAGFINDPEAGKFWLLYKGEQENGTVKHYTESPDKFILGNKDHLVMWYRTAHI